LGSSSSFGNSSLYGADSGSGTGRDVSGIGAGNRGRDHGPSDTEFGDLSLNSDFSADNLDPFSSQENSVVGSSAAANDVGNTATAYDSMGNSNGRGSTNDRLRRDRESLTPNQRLVRRRNPYNEIP